MASAQITITSADMPKANDSPRVSYSASIIDVSKTGPNYHWNFDSLISERQTAAQYLPSAKTPYSGSFKNDIGQKVADSLGTNGLEAKNVYEFYKNSTTSFNTVGEGFSYSSFPLASPYTIPDKIYIFPLQYGNRDSSTFYVKFSLLTLFGYLREGYRITTVDGYGSISTPYKNYDSCIRVHSITYEIDSINGFGIDTGTPLITEEYKWLVHGEVVPALEVDGTNVGGTFIPSSVIYRDSFRVSPLAPAPDFSANDTVVTTNDTVAFINETAGIGGGNSYVWAITPNTYTYINSNADSTNPNVKFAAPGKYSITLTATNFFGSGTKTKTNYITVTQASGIKSQFEADNNVNIYPNPATSTLTIESTDDPIQSIAIYDAMGKVVNFSARKSLNDKIITIPVNNLAPGIYMVKLGIEKGSYMAKFMKE